MRVGPVFLLFLLLGVISLHAQPALDSLRRVASDEHQAASARMEAMNTLANHYLHTSIDSMRLFGEQELELAQTSGDQLAEGRAKQVLGTSYVISGRVEEGITYLREGMSLSKAVDNSPMVGKTSFELGGAFLAQGDMDSARYYFQQALTIHETNGNQRAMASALGALGTLSNQLSEFDQAHAYFVRAIAVFEQLEDQRAQGMMYRQLAFIYVTRSQYEEGLAYCKQSLSLFEEIQDQREAANTLTTIGLTFFYQSQYDSARWYHLKSLEIHESLQDKRGMSYAYGNLGLVDNKAGNAAKAIENYEKSLRLKEELGDKRGIATSLQSLSKIYEDLEDYSLALKFAQRSFQIFEELGNTFKMAVILRNISMAHMQMEDYPLARTTAQQSLEICRKLGLVHEEAQTHLVMGAILKSEGKPDSAVLAYQTTLSLTDEERGLITVKSANLSLARLALEAEDWPNAIRYARSVLELKPGSTSATLTRNAADILWQSMAATGQKAKAFDYYQLYIQMRDSIASIDNQRAAIRYEFTQQAQADSLTNAALLTAEIEENKRRRTFSYFLLVGLGITFLFGLILFNRFRLTARQKAIIEDEKRKLDQANSELNHANQKLTELDNFKSQFFTNISHEFRTPLTVITGMTEQMEQQPDKWQKKGLALIDRNARGLLHLINQILDLRKLESGNLSLHPIQGDVIQALRLSLASFESMAESKDIELVFSPEEPFLQMDFDPEKLGQITNNLLSNAIKFTSEGGYISLRSFCKAENQLVIEVQDSGRGIPTEKLPYIFDRFYQVDASDTRQGEGTGVGLSLTKELVQLMGGKISVESTDGEGSTFTLCLPITRQAEIREAMMSLPSSEPLISATFPVATPSKEERPRLLIVEDNVDIVSYLYSILEDRYELSSAPDGQSGIAAALEQVPDLIITDVMMPEKNGYEVTETLKLDERSSHIPILMLTAKADADSRLEGYKRGADTFLAKPFNQEELLVRLDNLLKIRQKLQQRYQSGAALPPPQAEQPEVEQEDAFIQKVRDAVLANLDNANYKGTALCEDLSISRTNLHRKIKALTGQTTTYFIRSIRLEQAKSLLLQEDMQVAEVAYSTGFNDPAYFNRVFSELYQQSPGEWRDTQLNSS